MYRAILHQCRIHFVLKTQYVKQLPVNSSVTHCMYCLRIFLLNIKSKPPSTPLKIFASGVLKYFSGISKHVGEVQLQQLGGADCIFNLWHWLLIHPTGKSRRAYLWAVLTDLLLYCNAFYITSSVVTIRWHNVTSPNHSMLIIIIEKDLFLKWSILC